MQATTCFHDGVPNAIFQEADFIFHTPGALHPTNGMFNADSDGGNTTIGRFCSGSQFSTTWFLLCLEDHDSLPGESLKALILIQTATGWQAITCSPCQALIRRFAFTGRAQEAHVTGLVDHQGVFERMTFLLATVIRLLFFRIFRALAGAFGPVMHKRAEVIGSAVDCVASIMANSSAVRAGRSC
jgi:hypothetical protein